MKKIIIISSILLTISLLSGTSCTNVIEDFSKGQDTLLVMNALMQSDDSVHAAYLSLSHGPSVSPEPKGTVECYINGDLAATATCSSDEIGAAGKYCFKAVFKPGDEIMLKAVSGNRQTVAKVTVPQPGATISKTDTAKIRTYSNGGWNDYEQFKVTVNDGKGTRDYYRMALFLEKKLFDENGQEIAINNGYAEYDLDGSGDPVLSEGKIADSDNEDIFDGSPVNTYNIFTDQMFADGSYSIKANTPYGNLISYSSDAVFTEDYCLLSVTAYVKIYSISEKEFHYLKARSADDGDFISGEPVIFPTNVEGGLGFVGIASPAVCKIEFPDLKIDNIYY